MRDCLNEDPLNSVQGTTLGDHSAFDESLPRPERTIRHSAAEGGSVFLGVKLPRSDHEIENGE
eukprot:6362030-Prymnesium_polylepis.1